MTLADARAELYERGFHYFSSARANQFLEQASQELNERSAWPWLEATATGTGTVTISDLREVLYVLDTTNDLPLWPADTRDLVQLDPNFTTTTGSPDHYWLDDQTVRVYPLSAVSLSVRYLKVAPSVTGETDTPIFPARLDSTWINLAVIRAYLDRDNFDAAAALRGIVEGELQTAQENLIARTLDHPPQQVLTNPQNC